MIGPSAGNSFEMKFLLEETRAAQIAQWAAGQLPVDPHVEPGSNAYHTTTLYLDTPDLRVFWQGGRKYRVRRYGTSPLVFVERKARNGDQVRKRRTILSPEELPRLRQPMNGAWEGSWFHQRLFARALQPTCLIAYRRVAFLDPNPHLPLRLTIDQEVRGWPVRDWVFSQGSEGILLLPGQAILELKFRNALPSLFKRLIEEQGLVPSAVSKYRQCIRAWGLAPSLSEVTRA